MSILNKKRLLSGWGNFPKINCTTYRPEKISDIGKIISSRNNIIAYGQGKSYGDTALNSEYVIETDRLDRFISFDIDNGIIIVQAGVKLSDILDTIIPKGWYLPVIPGTKYISAGGAFASDVHGKNHYSNGVFSDHVIDIKLRIANGELLSCSRGSKPDLFYVTAGGMGLTGIIEEVTIKLKKIESISLYTETKKIRNLSEMIHAFEDAKGSYEYMIGWIDHFAKDQYLGKGIFEKANHINVEQGGTPLEQYKPNNKSINIPPFFPSFLLNKYSMALYNANRFQKYTLGWRDEIQDFDGFFHPLDNLLNWNNLYGKKGFFQYQCMIPDNGKVENNLYRILSMIHKKDCFSYLAVLKYHGDHKGLLSFPIKGYSLALDFPNTEKVHKLQYELNEFIAEIGGRVYLAKDALLTKEHFDKMYFNKLEEWKDIVYRYDNENKFQSELSKRLGIK